MIFLERKDYISVIIYVYNYKNVQNPQNLKAVLKSIQEQNTDIELIISEQGILKESPYKQMAIEFNAKYVLTMPDIIDGKTMYNIGRIRNAGALVSSGKYLYFSDADIFFKNKNYFSTILENSQKANTYNWFRPSMFRLSETTTKDFVNDYLGEKNINNFEYPDVCMVDYDSSLLSLKPILGGEYNAEFDSQNYVCTAEEFNLINSEGFNLEEAEELIWKARFHYGGTFCSFDNFLEVAGYCEVFYGYGCEDGDFQYKLKSKQGIEKMDKITTKSILHFEHGRSYNNQSFKNNCEINNKRRIMMIDDLIKLDINKEKSLVGSYIKGDVDLFKSFFIDEYIP